MPDTPWQRFKRNRRGFFSLIILLGIFFVSFFANFIANDRPLVVYFDGGLYFPVVKDYPETTFGGEFATPANYKDTYVQKLMSDKGFAIWPPITYAVQTINPAVQAPSPPSLENILGTDDQGRDVFARLLYGFRTSLSFGLCLTLFSAVIGLALGAVQGYMGGLVDLLVQRFTEIWQGLPVLYLLIILSSLIEPSFGWLLFVLIFFSWMPLVPVVRAEFFRTRSMDYIRAAEVLGVPTWRILLRHMLPNAMIAVITYLPFLLTQSITTLTSLDFLGFGLPPGSASIGEIINQAKNNIQAPWIGITAFVSLSLLLSLLVFVGEAVRDSFDRRQSPL